MSEAIASPDVAPATEPVAPAPPEPEATLALADTAIESAALARAEESLAAEELAAQRIHRETVAEVHAPPEPTSSLAETDEYVPLSDFVEPVAAPVKKRRTKVKAEAAPEPAPEAEAAAPPAEAGSTRKWYVVKVQSGREDTIRRDIERKVIIQGLEEFFGRIEIPFEEIVEKKKVKAKVKDKKTGEEDTVYQEKNVTKKRKKFPGYLFTEVDFNDRILYLFRETSGVGDFVGATQHRAPNPMNEHEVQSMLTGIAPKGGPKAGKVKIKLDFEKGDKIKIRDGAFSGMEGEVKSISEAKDATETPKVKVEVTIFGRPVEVELDYWQVDKA